MMWESWQCGPHTREEAWFNALDWISRTGGDGHDASDG